MTKVSEQSEANFIVILRIPLLGINQVSGNRYKGGKNDYSRIHTRGSSIPHSIA
jgi:hypothetical protein